MARVFLVGMATADFVFAVDDFPDQPRKYRAKHAEIVGGGGAANAAVGITRLGGGAQLAGRLGDDSMGDLIVNDLAAEGVETDLIHRAEGGQSSFSSVYVDSDGERQIMNFRGAGLAEGSGLVDSAPRADAVLVDDRWKDGAVAALDLAKNWGVPSILDGEAPIDPLLLARSSHVAFSRPGLQAMSDIEDTAEALAEVSLALPGWACVTDGENGVFYTSENGIAHIPAFHVSVVDTLGAGDVWHGAFALGLAEGQSEVESIRFASAAAALKCTKFGGREGCPSREEVLKLMKEQT